MMLRARPFGQFVLLAVMAAGMEMGFGTAAARGQWTNTWANAAGGTYSVGTNWQPNGVPIRGLFNLPGTYTVVADSTGAELYVTNGDVTFDLRGGTLNLDVFAGYSDVVGVSYGVGRATLVRGFATGEIV